jgi:membrane protease YdiL (CAAX protease family)
MMIVLNYIPQLVLVLLIKNTDIIGEDFKVHTLTFVIVGTLLSYLVIFHYFWKPLPDLKNVLHTKPLNVSLIAILLLLAFGLGFIFQPLMEVDKVINYYASSEMLPYQDRSFHPHTIYIYRTFSTLFIAPVFEELFFRKFLFKKLLRNYSLWTAIIVSSILFSAIHFETPRNLAPTFIGGILTCWIYYKSKNIWYPILLHFFNNLFTALYDVFGNSFFAWVHNLQFDFMYWALFSFGILIMILAIKNIEELTKKPEQ